MIRTWIVLVATTCFGLTSCKQKDNTVARLESMTATVERSPAPDAAWVPAEVGDRFLTNSAVRTGPASKARLRVGRGGFLDLEQNALVRFVSDPGATTDGAKQRDLRIEAGAVQIETGDEQVSVGGVRIEPRGRARLEAGEDGVRIDVAVGQVVLEDGETVGAGESVVVNIGGAIVEEIGTKAVPVDAAVVAEVDAGVEDDAIVGGTTKVTVTGKPARYRASAGWQLLPVGEHELADGSRINTPRGSNVTLSRDGAVVGFGGGTEVRLTAEDNPATVALFRGAVTLTAESGKASAALRGGSVVIESGMIHAAMVKGGTEIEARRGDAMIRSVLVEEKLQEGDTATLSPDGKITFQNRAPTRVVFSFPAGESPTIHDVRAPTPVRVRFPGTCGGGRLEVAKNARFARILARAGGRTGGNALLAPGSYAYRVRCENKKVIRGGIRVLKDSGRKPLPKAAPRTLVEPDGREYFVSYQNLLPEFTLVWRDAPPRSSYQFVVQPASGEARRIKSTTPRVSLKSGELGEGSYKFWVEIPETGGRSAEARIVIDFDNAAATASIAKVTAKGGGAVAVRGAVIEGTTVTAGDSPIALDRHQRFDAELAPREGEDGVAIRIAHPKLGVHYYVLRSSK